MATWPSTLPNPLAGSVSESLLPNIVRSNMDIGPDKVRRRGTADIGTLSFTLLLTETQITTLDTFFRTTVASGAISFFYTHPRTAATVTARFTKPYELTHHSRIYWRAAISLEILP